MDMLGAQNRVSGLGRWLRWGGPRGGTYKGEILANNPGLVPRLDFWKSLRIVLTFC